MGRSIGRQSEARPFGDELPSDVVQKPRAPTTSKKPARRGRHHDRGVIQKLSIIQLGGPRLSEAESGCCSTVLTISHEFISWSLWTYHLR